MGEPGFWCLSAKPLWKFCEDMRGLSFFPCKISTRTEKMLLGLGVTRTVFRKRCSDNCLCFDKRSCRNIGSCRNIAHLVCERLFANVRERMCVMLLHSSTSLLVVLDLGGVFLVRMECPAWRSGGRRPFSLFVRERFASGSRASVREQRLGHS